jgi:acyl-CoA synthetase (AMP-forming)/AMP-acid ligase II
MSEAMSVAELLREQARERPDAPAITIDGRRQTWGELARSAASVANWLRSEADAARGERVAILMPNSVEWVVWAFGAATAGCTFVPLNTKLKGPELAYQLRHSGAVALIAAGDAAVESLAPVLVLNDSGAYEGLPAVREAISLGPHAPWATREEVALAKVDPWSDPPAVDPDDVLLIQYTSGTTAFPKGVMLTNFQVLTNARGVAGRLHLTEDDRIASPSPFFHVAGTTLLLFIGMVAGASIYSFGRFDPEVVLNTIEREQITMFNGVETFFISLMKHPSFTPDRVRSIRGGWLSASVDLLRQVHEEMGLHGVVNVYGISEASPNVTIPDANEPEEVRRTCGKPHSGMEVRIVDESGREQPAGVIGLIEARGPCVMKGYLDDPEQTAATVDAEGWLTTGDLGSLDEDGNLIYEGRAKDRLRVGGENVSPAEIEAVLLTHPDLSNAAVIGVPHETLLEVPMAFVVPHQGRDVDPAAISEFVSGRLASYKVPRRVMVLEELPMTGSAKVRKADLIQLAESSAGG